MPFNGSGIFVRNFSWVSDASNSIPITASRMDSDTNDIALGLTNCVTRDGQSTPTANLPMGGFKFTNVANASASNEYVTLGQTGGLYLPLAGGTLTGTVTTANIPVSLTVQQGASGAIGQSAANLGGLIVRGVGTGNGAYAEFLRDAFGAYFGLDTDNAWKVGGLSMGANSYRVVHEGLSSVFLPGSLTAATQLSSPSISATSGGITTSGAGSGFNFIDRVNSGQTWTWFASGGVANLFSASAGPLIAVNYTTGNTTVAGTWTGPNFIATSDRDLKHHMAFVEPRQDLADRLSMASFAWKNDGRKDRGVYAQDVREFAPEYVYDNDGTLGVDKATLALEAVAGLAARVRVLEGDFR